MSNPLRAWIVPAAGFALLMPLSGCGVDNAASMAGTKGTAAPDAPKTQAEFFKQQQELAAQVKARKGAAKPADAKPATAKPAADAKPGEPK